MEETTTKLLQSFAPNFYKDTFFSCGSGWFNLLVEFGIFVENYCEMEGKTLPEIHQIKEKFGSLTIYLAEYDQVVDEKLMEIQTRSEVTCEHCGEPGVMRDNSWIKVLCNTCQKQRDTK